MDNKEVYCPDEIAMKQSDFWIPSTDCLPKDMRRMWVCNERYIYVARYDTSKKVFYDIEHSIGKLGETFFEEIKGVTHWMPVPNSPRKGGNV